MFTKTITDRGILFEAFLAMADRTAGRHIGTITAFSPSAAQTAYSKLDETGNTVEFEADNFVDSISLTLQFKDGAATPEVNEEIILVPVSVFDRQWFGIYRLTQKATPSQSQNGVRTVAVSAQRAMNGANKQTQVPVQPAMFTVESYDSGTHTYTLRNIGGVAAPDGSDHIIVNPDRLLAVTGYDFPASIDATEMLFTPAADVDAGDTASIVLTAVAP